jgi:hypothetical protein
LKPYLKLFGNTRVRVIFNESLKAEPEKTVQGLLEWLGVTPDIEHIDLRKRTNRGGLPRYEWLNSILSSLRLSKIPILYKLLPPGIINGLFILVKRPLIMMNLRKNEGYPPMSPETRKKLLMHFRPFNRELEALLDVDLSHWDI